MEQRWLIGSHSDIGGYKDRRLSDMTLHWIQDRASTAGLVLNIEQVGDENCRGELTDSYAQFLGDTTLASIRGTIVPLMPLDLVTKLSTNPSPGGGRKIATMSRQIMNHTARRVTFYRDTEVLGNSGGNAIGI